MSDKETYSVPVTVWLKPTAYRKLNALGEQHDTSVSVVVSRLVDRVTQSPPPPKPRSRYMTSEQVAELVLLVNQGHSDRAIGARLGFTTNAVQQRRRKLGLPRNYNPIGAS